MRHSFRALVHGVTAAVLFTLISPAIAAAQDGSWTSVQSLSPGASIDVRGATRKDRISGKLVSVTPDAITVERRGDQRTFERDDVQRVQTVNEHKTRWLLVGIAAGVGAGLAVGRATLESSYYCDPFRRCTGPFPQEPGVGKQLLLTGVIVGTMTPFLWLSRNKTVYEK